MYRNYYQPQVVVWMALLVMAVGACRVPQRLTQPTTIEGLPAQYPHANADSSASAGATPWKLFFKDTLLQRLIDTAIYRNLDLQSYEQQVNIARNYLDMSKALSLPALDAVLNAQADRYAFYTMNGVGNYDLNKSSNISPEMRIPNVVPDVMLGLRSNWEIDVWGKLKNMKRSALSRYLATEQGKLLLQTNIVAEVAHLYYELLGLDVELRVVRKNSLLQQDALDIVKAQKLGGRATELAVQQFEALLYKTRAIEFSVKQQLAETENRLNLLLGRYPQPIDRAMDLQQLQLPVKTASGIPANLLVTRPDVHQALYELTAAYQDVAAARAMYYPTFTITPYVGLQGFRLLSFFDAQSIAAGIAGNITGPLFNRKRVRGHYRVSEAQAKQSWIGYNKTVQTAVAEVLTNLQGIDNLARQFALKQEEVAHLNTAISSANDLYANGFANYLEVITAQTNLVDAEIELALLKKMQFQRTVALYRATGGGWR